LQRVVDGRDILSPVLTFERLREIGKLFDIGYTTISQTVKRFDNKTKRHNLSLIKLLYSLLYHYFKENSFKFWGKSCNFNLLT